MAGLGGLSMTVRRRRIQARVTRGEMPQDRQSRSPTLRGLAGARPRSAASGV